MSSDIELWFDGYVGIDSRITVTRLPEKFSFEAWEVLDDMLRDNPTIDMDVECLNNFYRFELKTCSGFEGNDECQYTFEIEDYNKITK
jgi:hypothetical protein